MIHVGISGWTYPGWRGVFYPEDLPQRSELEYASHQFSSIEINNTHYNLQRPATFAKWKERTPKQFVFSVKGNRYVTHRLRLRDVKIPLANIFASGVLRLEEKLGPMLWQTPPSLRFNAEELEAFLKLLPKTIAGARKLSYESDLENPDSGETLARTSRKLRHSLEVRHGSFMQPEFFALLRKYHVAFVFADTAGKWPYAEEVTSDFIYIRLHGDEELYVSGYGDRALRFWAKRIKKWHEGDQPSDAKRVTPEVSISHHPRDVYVYFDNDAKVKAPGDALSLRKLL